MSAEQELSEEDARFVEHVKRIHERYLIEIVERFNLCPWAAGARRNGGTAMAVVLDKEAAPDETARTALRLFEPANESHGAQKTSVGFVLLPNHDGDRATFERFANQVRKELGHNRATIELSSGFAIAPFHPQAQLDLRSPDTLVPYLRRSPFPTLQLIPTAILDALGSSERTDTLQPWMLCPVGAASESSPTVRDQVSLDNFDTVRSDSEGRIDGAFADLVADRDQVL